MPGAPPAAAAAGAVAAAVRAAVDVPRLQAQLDAVKGLTLPAVVAPDLAAAKAQLAALPASVRLAASLDWSTVEARLKEVYPLKMAAELDLTAAKAQLAALVPVPAGVPTAPVPQANARPGDDGAWRQNVVGLLTRIAAGMDRSAVDLDKMAGKPAIPVVPAGLS